MDVPVKFPPGCKFMSSFGGDEFVCFPDGKWFVLNEAKGVLAALPAAPVSKGTTSSEEYFLGVAAKARTFP